MVLCYGDGQDEVCRDGRDKGIYLLGRRAATSVCCKRKKTWRKPLLQFDQIESLRAEHVNLHMPISIQIALSFRFSS